MSKGDAFWNRRARLKAMRDAEASGVVADSIDVRIALMARVDSGEITLEEAQAELRRIKRGAKAAGKVTRNQAYRGR